MMKLKLLLIIALMCIVAQGAWTQNIQRVDLSNNNTDQTLIVDETIEEVVVSANLRTPKTSAELKLTVPEGFIMNISGQIENGQTAIYWDSGQDGPYGASFSDVWVENDYVEIAFIGNSEININVNVKIYNPKRIKTEEQLRRFINHGVSDLGVVADITLDEYLKIGRNALDQAVAQNVTIDLNDHTLQRSGLSSPESDGHVIEVFGVGTLTLKNGTLAGGYANNGGGICNFGAVTLNNVTISECKARDGGGGIMNYGDATLTITGGAFNNCLSNAGGGAIVNHGMANISGCTFDTNTAYTRGGAIWNDATLTVSNCTFTGNQAPVSGVEGDGGTFHLDGGTANLSNVTITNSYSTNGGAIYVSDGATLTVDGSRIEKNTSDESGGAIADYGTLNMKGSLIVKNNTPDDVYLAKGKKINVINALTGGENSIGINMEKPGVFTDGYSTYYATVPAYPFFAYGINSTAMLTSGDHAYECAWVYGYMECSWDEATQTVTHTRRLLTESYQNLCSSTFASGGNLQPGWYIVEGTANIGSNSFTCVPDGSGTVHIILCDDASITANGLYLNTTDLDYNYVRKALHIYSQSYGDKMGKLKVVNTHDRLSAAIGAAKKADNAGYATGDIYIHGGDIHGEVNASGHTDERPDGAGIGTGRSGQGGSITIFDGKIYAQGGIGGAGIGSGGGSGGRPSITIHGGTITAKGGMSGAGIGDGAETQSISNAIRITGGTIQATGGGGTYGTSAQIGNLKLSAGAGIGTGGNAMGSAKFTIAISGGTVTAQGGTGRENDGCKGGAAGIGTGGDVHLITNNTITESTVTISGGEVYAHGSGLYESSQRDGAGIGGGYACPGCKVTISGGKVTAVSGLDGSSAIGAGDEPIGASSGSLDDGTLSLPANYSVKAGNNSSSLSLSSATSRQSKCWREFYAVIEPCMHSQARVSIVDAHYHMPTRSCGYCEVTADTHEPHVFGDYGECAACGIISLSDDASNADIISHWAGKEKTVVLTGRTLYKDNAWNTLCLPFSTSTTEDDLDGATVKTLESSSFSGGTLMLNFSESNLTNLAAGKPYIVKWSGGSDITDPLFWYVTFSPTASDATSEWVDFIGTTSPTVIYEDSEDKTKLYLGADNTLYYPTREGFTVNSCRGYFCLKNELTAGEPRHTAVRTFLLRFVEDPLTEGSNFGDGSDDVTPINDQVKMKDDNDTDAVWFDLSGRRLATKPTHPGIYMNKGNKIIIK